MKKLLLILLCLFSVESYAGQRIPYLAEIKKAARRHNLDWRLYASIVMVESRATPAAYNEATGDYGIAQINNKTAVLWGFDVTELQSDVDYNLDAGAIILADMQKRYAKREPKTWFCRYNVGTGKLGPIRHANCKRYLKLVSDWRAKLF